MNDAPELSEGVADGLTAAAGSGDGWVIQENTPPGTAIGLPFVVADEDETGQVRRAGCLARLYYTVLHCTALYYTVLHCTALYCTVLRCLILRSCALARLLSRACGVLQAHVFSLVSLDGPEFDNVFTIGCSGQIFFNDKCGRVRFL